MITKNEGRRNVSFIYNLICLHYTVFDCKITHMESKFSIDNERLADLFKLQPSDPIKKYPCGSEGG